MYNTKMHVHAYCRNQKRKILRIMPIKNQANVSMREHEKIKAESYATKFLQFKMLRLGIEISEYVRTANLDAYLLYTRETEYRTKLYNSTK